MIKPKYVCQKCKKKFQREKPGPTECPFCNHIYVDWVNYKEWDKEYRSKEN